MSLTTFWPLSFLLIAVVDDLCFKKFHNWLFIGLSALGFVSVFLFSFMEPVDALGGFFAGGLIMLPLFLIGATGAGDLKFMMSFGILMGTIPILEVFIYSLFWAALIGILQSLFAGKFFALIRNLTGFFYKLRPSKVQKIPYTVAILLGWLTHSFQGGLL